VSIKFLNHHRPRRVRTLFSPSHTYLSNPIERLAHPGAFLAQVLEWQKIENAHQNRSRNIRDGGGDMRPIRDGASDGDMRHVRDGGGDMRLLQCGFENARRLHTRQSLMIGGKLKREKPARAERSRLHLAVCLSQYRVAANTGIYRGHRRHYI
jgi:hypothetical protein